MTTAAEQLDKKFGIRHYEALRREALAPAIGRIGIAGAERAHAESLKQRRRTEVISLFTEAMKPERLRSVIDNVYPIEINDRRLVAEDGEPISSMLLRAQDSAAALAAEDPFFEPFLPARNQAEIDEHAEQNAMVRGETSYDTIITFSPYSEEFDDGTKAAQHKLVKAEQKPYWKRAMVRVSHAGADGFHIANISIDNSSVALLREVAKELFGYEFAADNSTEMLAERLHLNAHNDSWRTLTKDIAEAADKILERRTGVKHKQGNPESDVRQAQAYVESQPQIVDGFLAQDRRLALVHGDYESYELAVAEKAYDAIALLEARLKHSHQTDMVEDYDAAASGAGALARAEGKSYDACGLILAPEQQPATAGQKTGFESLLRLENQKVSCPECHKKVVVPKAKLEAGHLYCKECGYELDVCTGRKSFGKSRERGKNQRVRAYDILSSGFKRAGAQARLARLTRSRRAAKDELTARRLDKAIKAEAHEIVRLRQAA